MTRSLHLVALLGVFLAGGTAWADVVHLRDGRTIEGSITDDGDHLLVRHRFGEARVAKADVLRVEDTDDPWDRLDQMRKDLAAGTAEQRYRYACFAREHGFDDEARQAFLSVLRIDLDHPGARAALGYVRHEGRWLTTEDRNRLIGLVEYKDRWVTPERKAELEEEDRQAALARRKAREEAEAAEEAARLARKEAEREERRERIEARERALRAARARARIDEAYARQRRYGTGTGSVLYGGRTVLYPGTGVVYGCSPRPIYGPRGIAGWRCPSSGHSHGYRYHGARLSGSTGGSNWNLRWRVGF